MGLFKSSEEKAKSQRKKDEIMESGVSYMGYPLQNIGPITTNSVVTIKMYPDMQKIILSGNKSEIELPYERVLGFSIDDEVQLTSGKVSIGGAIIGSSLFGSAGAIIGAFHKKGKTKTNWIGTLLYMSKENIQKELNFLTYSLGNSDKKTFQMSQFEISINKIAVRKFDNQTFEL